MRNYGGHSSKLRARPRKLKKNKALAGRSVGAFQAQSNRDRRKMWSDKEGRSASRVAVKSSRQNVPGVSDCDGAA
jgi:hypothetical protein